MGPRPSDLDHLLKYYVLKRQKCFDLRRRREATKTNRVMSIATTWWRRRRGKDPLDEADDPLPMDSQGITFSQQFRCNT